MYEPISSPVTKFGTPDFPSRRNPGEIESSKRHMRILLVLILFCPLAQDSEIESLVDKLGASKLSDRDDAMDALRKLGKKALPALRKAAQSKDADISARAHQLIQEIDWPYPGKSVGGLAIAIKADKKYKLNGKILLRGRLFNTGKEDILLVNANAKERDEGGPFYLKLNDGRELHFCFRGKAPRPSKLSPRFTLKKGQFVEFTCSPRAWCALVEHSKCMPVQIAAREYRLSISFSPWKTPKGAWKGKITSNEVRFIVEKP